MVLWAFNYPVAKFGYRELDGLTLGTLRVLVAALCLVPIHLAFRRNRPLRRPLLARDYWVLACLGFFMAFNQGLFIYGLSYTTVGHSALIIAIGPVNILVLAVLVGLERLTLNKVAGVLLAFSGVVLLASGHGLGSHNPTLRGDLLTLGGSLAFAGYAIVGKRVTSRLDTMTMTCWPFYFGALIFSPLAFRQIARTDWSRVGWIGWGALLYIGLGASLFGYLIWMWAIHHLAASRMGVFTYVQPVLGTLIGVYLLHENYTGQLLLSGVLVLTGVALTEMHPRGTEAEDESSG
ncbi:MAG TPA: DMT family transporter [Candidatus Binatia bacterium]|nr:DMT family transporter [Candidatus Binatia bacterium]